MLIPSSRGGRDWLFPQTTQMVKQSNHPLTSYKAKLPLDGLKTETENRHKHFSVNCWKIQPFYPFLLVPNWYKLPKECPHRSIQYTYIKTKINVRETLSFTSWRAFFSKTRWNLTRKRLFTNSLSIWGHQGNKSRKESIDLWTENSPHGLKHRKTSAEFHWRSHIQ